MYVCICNGITETMLQNNPQLIKECGTNCGKCLEWLAENKVPGTNQQLKKRNHYEVSSYGRGHS